ncbi:MAG: type II toxin-antitoxin system RelE/ParE family toxin [Saprospiraceae bacterium]|nr:type II toxin-antitoxin system RelE/ParE family toxin [Saprospiraceae bacterium]
MKIKWTKRAQKSFDNTVEYLQDEWSINSSKKFVRKVNKFIEILKLQPQIGKSEIIRNDIRSFVISRQITVFYRLKKDTIILLKFFDTRQNPTKKLK